MAEKTGASESGRTLYIYKVGVWKTPQGAIHIATPGNKDGFHTTVNNTPGSERYHKNLYKHLDRMLSEVQKQDDAAGG